MPFAALLRTVNPELVDLWRGAKAAIQSDNPDRARHVIVSLRELTMHVLHTLASDDDVRKWTSEDKHYHQGRPTREARLLFLCNPVNVDSFTDFIVEDVRSHIAFIRVLNGATHRMVLSLTDVQLSALVAKAEGLIRFLISIRQSVQ